MKRIFRFFLQQIKDILKYPKDFLKTEFHWGLYIFVLVFLAIALVANYFGFEKSTMDYELTRDFRGKITYIPVLFGYFFFPYLVVLVAQAIFLKRFDELKQIGYWATVIFAFLLLATNLYFYQYQTLAKDLSIWLGGENGNTNAYKWIRLTMWNLKSSIFYFIPIFLYWLLFDRKNPAGLYGFSWKKFNAKPYFTMLVIMLPIIAGVSFLDGFRLAYPQYKPGVAEAYLGWPKWITVGIFELIYGFDFTFVELFFRGFLVIGLAKWLGKRAILPMVATYCFIHFGKPAGEAIGSIFGGFLLGIIAYYSRSIWGGVIAHLGVAWLMELFGHLQLAFSSKPD